MKIILIWVLKTLVCGGRVAVGEFNGVGYLIIGGALDKFYKVRT